MWLKDKKILDIGSSNGVVDLLLAVRHQPKLIIGVDIDHRQVRTAIDNMQKAINDSEQMCLLLEHVRKQKVEEDHEMVAAYEADKKKVRYERELKLRELLKRVEALPLSLQVSIQGELNNLTRDPANFIGALHDEKAVKCSERDLKNYLYGKVCFRTENYLASPSCAEKFDVVFCLSTIKYIHLNFGDQGLKALFLKAYN